MRFARGLFSQFEVVHALVLRETRTRFGSHQLGYLWALLEPLAMIMTFYGLMALAGRQAPGGMEPFGFLCTGMVPYLLFANATQRVADSISGNKALLFYPHVFPIDLVIARSLLEMATYAVVFMVLMGGNILLHQQVQIDSALIVVAGFALAGFLGMTLGLVFCALGQYSNAVDRARGPLLRPFFWVSGIFFTADSLPTGVREALLYNPLLHAVELVRGGWYGSYDTDHVDGPYVLAWVLGLAFVGLSLERKVRRRIELS